MAALQRPAAQPDPLRSDRFKPIHFKGTSISRDSAPRLAAHRALSIAAAARMLRCRHVASPHRAPNPPAFRACPAAASAALPAPNRAHYPTFPTRPVTVSSNRGSKALTVKPS